MNLISKSIDIIKNNQSETGAYVASPNFESYNYSWFRDGAYIAYSMCLVDEFDSARAFHVWCSQVIVRYKDVVQSVLERLAKGEKLAESEFLPTRFTLEGEAVDDEWTNFQTDGFGTWLWSLAEYIKLSGDTDILTVAKEGIELCIEYLLCVWKEPCYDCWEEHLEYVHTYTLGSIFAGLNGVSKYFENYTDKIDSTLKSINEYIETRLIKENQLIKMRGTDRVETERTLGIDASLLGMLTPYNMYNLSTEIGRNTLSCIERDIQRTDGGVYRYLEDTYFGGGEWILLACWLGWCYAEAGENEKAEKIIKWTEKNADAKGQLPEQVLDNVFNPDKLIEWEERWGENAQPLLWSHAMYIILKSNVEK